MEKRMTRWTRVRLTFAMLVGVTMQLGWIPSCETIATTVNPCGTVLGFCNQEDVDLLFADIPDYELDPTCTIPFYGLDPDNAGTAGGCANTDVFPNTPGNRPG